MGLLCFPWQCQSPGVPLAPKDCSLAQAEDDGIVIADAHGVPVWFREVRSGVWDMAHSGYNACLLYTKP